MTRDPQWSGQRPEAFFSRFVAQMHAISVGRLAFAGWMRGAGIGAETAEDLEVVFSELAANAVTASPDTSDEVRVRARVDDASLHLEVSNRTERPDDLPLSAPDQEDTLRQRGRGLLITRALMDSVGMEMQLPDRFIVRCRRVLADR